MPGFPHTLLLFNHFEACRAPEMPHTFFPPASVSYTRYSAVLPLHYSSLKLYHKSFLTTNLLTLKTFIHLLRGSTVVNRVYDTKAKLDVRRFTSLSSLDVEQTEKNGHNLL